MYLYTYTPHTHFIISTGEAGTVETEFVAIGIPAVTYELGAPKVVLRLGLSVHKACVIRGQRAVMFYLGFFRTGPIWLHRAVSASRCVMYLLLNRGNDPVHIADYMRIFLGLPLSFSPRAPHDFQAS